MAHSQAQQALLALHGSQRTLDAAGDRFRFQHALTASTTNSTASSHTRTHRSAPPLSSDETLSTRRDTNQYAIALESQVEFRSGTTLTMEVGAHENDETTTQPSERNEKKDTIETSLSLSLRHPLWRGNARELNQADETIAQRALLSARENYTRNLTSHLMEVIQAYRSVTDAYQSLEIARDALSTAQTSRVNASRLVDAGRLARVELARADLVVATRRAEVNNLEGNFRNALLQLNRYTSCQYGPDTRLEELPVLSLPSALDEGNIHSTIRSLSVIQQAQRQLQDARLELALTRNQRKPRLDFVAAQRWSTSSTESNQHDWHQAQRQRNRGYELRLEFEMPLTHYSTNRRIEAQGDELVRRQFALDDARLDASIHLQQLVTRINSARQQVSLAEERVQLAQLEHRQSMLQFDAGHISSVTLDESRERQADAQQALNTARSELSILIFESYQAIEQFSLGLEQIGITLSLAPPD